jgi:hypothetical protein
VRSNAVMTCRSVVSETVGGGYDALVDGHRRALAEVSTQIAAAVRAMAATAVAPPATTGKTSRSARSAAAAVVPPCPAAETGAGAGA